MRKIIFLIAIIFSQFIFVNAAPERKSLPRKANFLRHKSLKKVKQYKAAKSSNSKIEWCGSCKKSVAKYYLPGHRALCHYDEFKHDPKISKLIVFCKVPECGSSNTRMLSGIRLQHYKESKASTYKIKTLSFKVLK